MSEDLAELTRAEGEALMREIIFRTVVAILKETKTIDDAQKLRKRSEGMVETLV
jgi:energy-coupling factor transporter transmembrane protein EcfT